MHIFSDLRSHPQWLLPTGFLTISGAVLEVVASAWILLRTFPLIKRFSLLPGFLFVCFFGHTSGTKRGFTRSLHYSALLINPTRRVSMAFPVRYTPCEKRHQSFGLTTQEHPSMFCNTLTISLRLLWVPIAFARHTSASHPAAQPATSYQDGEGSVASHDERVKAFFFPPLDSKSCSLSPEKTLGHDVPGPRFQLLRRCWLHLASYNWFNWQDTFFNTPAEPSGWTRTGSTGSGTY